MSNNEIKIKKEVTMQEWVDNFKDSLILLDGEEAMLKEIKLTFGDGEKYESRAIMTEDYEPDEVDKDG